MATWRSYNLDNLLASHPDVPLKVVRGSDVTTPRHPSSYMQTLNEWATSIRSGNVSRSDYVFTDIRNTTIADDLPELSDLFSEAMCSWRKDFCASQYLARGILGLLYGGEGSGNKFHRHGPALVSVIAGEKYWQVEEPPKRSMTVVTPDGSTMQPAEPPRRWECLQVAGELFWVPDGFLHATDNRADEVVALSALQDSAGATALHTAAVSGDAREVELLVKQPGADLNAEDGNGFTALSAASFHGYLDVVCVLLSNGANVNRMHKGPFAFGTALHAAKGGPCGDCGGADQSGSGVGCRGE